MSEPRNLNPSVPADAVQIIDILTADLALSRRNGEVFRQALTTLMEAVKPKPDPEKPANA